MDPIGFGLENYDAQGRFRATEKGNAACMVTGDGELTGAGMAGTVKFNGPAELGKALSDADVLEPCLIQQVYRFAVGRTELNGNDLSLVSALTEGFKGKQATLKIDDLMADLVSSEPFRFRREEVTQ